MIKLVLNDTKEYPVLCKRAAGKGVEALDWLDFQIPKDDMARAEHAYITDGKVMKWVKHRLYACGVAQEAR